MSQRKIRAVYMRGGTSRCLIFHDEDLPHPGPARDRILLAALGSPDPYGRQLDGLGGGLSSLSKACIVGRPRHPDAQVDYTFAQVDVRHPMVDYAGNCGNCSSSIGPFAIDEKLVEVTGSTTRVHIHNTNTKKVIIAHVPVRDGEAAVDGDFELPGVAGHGAKIRLDFLDPGGAVTGRLLPTGRASDVVDGLEASLVDATNPMVFVRASAVGLSGAERPEQIDADQGLAARLEAIRVEAATRMGVPPSPAVPKIVLVGPARPFTTLNGRACGADEVSLVARVISMGNCHRAVALTSAMCLAVAARIAGTVVHECVGGGSADPHDDVLLGHPSGVLPIAASVVTENGAPRAERVTVYRTARRLMEGFVRVP